MRYVDVLHYLAILRLGIALPVKTLADFSGDRLARLNCLGLEHGLAERQGCGTFRAR